VVTEHGVVWQKFSDISEKCNASTFRVKEEASQVTSEMKAEILPDYTASYPYSAEIRNSHNLLK
jgi:hypothetical protein